MWCNPKEKEKEFSVYTNSMLLMVFARGGEGEEAERQGVLLNYRLSPPPALYVSLCPFRAFTPSPI